MKKTTETGYQVGDRVVMLPSWSSSTGIKAGMRGTVRTLDGGNLGVEWDGFTGGHDLGLDTGRHDGWYVDRESVVLRKKATVKGLLTDVDDLMERLARESESHEITLKRLDKAEQDLAGKEEETMKMLEDIQRRSADIAERHREERGLAKMEGYSEGRYDGFRIMVEALGYRLRVREDRFLSDRFEWTLESGISGISLVNAGDFTSSDAAAEDAIAKVPGHIKSLAWDKAVQQARSEAHIRTMRTVETLETLLKEAVQELRAGYSEAGVLESEKPDWITSRAEAAIRRAR